MPHNSALFVNLLLLALATDYFKVMATAEDMHIWNYEPPPQAQKLKQMESRFNP